MDIQNLLNEDYYKFIFFNSPTAMLTVNLQRKIVDWNPAAEKLFGYSANEVIGENVDDIVARHDSIRGEARKYTKELISNRKEVIHTTTKRTHKNGSLIDIELSAVQITIGKNPIGFAGVYHDIRGLKKTEEELRRLKEYYEALFLNSPAAITSVDSKANVVSWNPIAEKLFGYSRDEAIGKNLDSLVANNDAIRVEAEAYTQQALNSQQFHATSKRTRKDGTMIEVEILALPTEIRKDDFGFIVIYHDISELVEARRLAEEANLAKSEFLARMSHELRTPLNAIIGFSRLIKRKSENILPPTQLENLDRVLMSADHLLNLINDVLDISKIEAGKMLVETSRFHIESVVDVCLQLTQPLLNGKKIRLSKQIKGKIPQLFTDQEKLKQIILNLISNAIKFTHEGFIKILVEKRKNNLFLSVIDSGIGISKEAIDRIFGEFQQADMSTTRKYGGTGLGLSISHKLAKLLGGELNVVSKVGKGSTFTLIIPLSYQPKKSE